MVSGDQALKNLRRLTIKGFKSIKTMDLELSSLNILIGANGAGKSNLISFFKMLSEMMEGHLQRYVGVSGSAQSLLHFGSKITPHIEAKLEFNSVEYDLTDVPDLKEFLIPCIYTFKLIHAAGDKLIFGEEAIAYNATEMTSSNTSKLGEGQEETTLVIIDDSTGKTDIRNHPIYLPFTSAICGCHVYHFHDTSSTAGIRQSCYVGDSRFLSSDARNIAALLLRFRKEKVLVYQLIVRTIRLIAPFFDDFVLEPDASHNVILNWQEKDSDRVFGPHQFSDGTLRVICLVTLLLQPKEQLPKLIIVDEPELGLHPYALHIIAALFQKASLYTQILISTQSSIFLDNFKPEDVIVVNREGKESQFKRLNPTELADWLEEYSLGEVWEKNIIGGGPH